MYCDDWSDIINMNKEKKSDGKGENRMDAYAVKPSIEMPFVTSKILKRTPATQENRDRIKYMDSHEFSFKFDKATGMFVNGVKKNEL